MRRDLTNRDNYGTRKLAIDLLVPSGPFWVFYKRQSGV